MTQGQGTDVLTERALDDATVRSALAAWLDVATERVAVIDDRRDSPSIEVADIVCVKATRAGEFRTSLSIDGRAEQAYASEAEAMQRLCELLATRLLVSDDDVNPYTMWLLAPGAPRVQVGLDADAIDDARYAIARPLTG